jgi:Dullard-like phosphatase family protein
MNSLQYLSTQVDRVIGHSSANSSSHSGRSSGLGLMVSTSNPQITIEPVVEEPSQNSLANDDNSTEIEEPDSQLFSPEGLRSLRSYKSNDMLGVSDKSETDGRMPSLAVSLDSTDEGLGTSGSEFDSSAPSSPELKGKESDDLSTVPSSNLLDGKSFKLSARTIIVLLTKLLYLFIPETRMNPLSYFWPAGGNQSQDGHNDNNSIDETQDTLHTLRRLQSPYGTTHQSVKRQPLTGITNFSSRNLQPPRPLLAKNPIKKTLVLDLDETLIHSLSRGSRFSAGQMVEVKLESQFATLYFVNKRPFCDEFLRSVSQWYKLVVFTASVQAYADPMIDWLEQERKYFSQRLYRQHCTVTPNGYIKDLSKIHGDLSKVVIVDNSPISYAMHEENAISVEGWISDPTDRSLQNLVPLLHALHYSGDVRSFLSLKGGDSAFDYC